MQSKRNILKTGLERYLIVLALSLFFNLNGQQQIANYISNGGFEQKYNCNIPNDIGKVKFWRSIDSISYGNTLLVASCYSNTPYTPFGFQYPRKGNSFALFQSLCTPTLCTNNNSRGYLRNRLKTNLVAGKTYCVKVYVVVSENSPYGNNGTGIYFGDDQIDTITQFKKPLTYIVPQVQPNSIISDTLNWTLLTGTFVANGTEKHCLIGNFKSDAAVSIQSLNISTTHSNFYSPCFTCTYTNVYIDDVSCIPTDLPAYAGPDLWAIPGQTVYIGRTQDVGIDEACTWYNMSNTLTPIANVAGMTLTVALSTQTYMVKQDICGIIKYDTVIVHASGLGNAELQYLNDNLKLYPQPAKDFLSIETPVSEEGLFTRLSICNAIGQAIREEELHFNNGSVKLSVADLPEGFYTLQFSTSKGYTIKKSLVVSR